MKPSDVLDSQAAPSNPASTSGLRIRDVPLSELELQHDRDWEWAFHNPAIRQLYSEQVIAVFKERVWGNGQTRQEALANALSQPDCPERKWFTVLDMPLWVDLETIRKNDSMR